MRVLRNYTRTVSVGQWVDAATIRGARVAVIACALVLSLLVVASLGWPQLVFWSPERDPEQRLLLALVIGMPLSLGLALRDPVRNAGVFAVIGLGCGFLAAARLLNFFAPFGSRRVFVQADGPQLWSLGTILFLAVAVALVVTYTRLRRPHPIVVRVVVLATVLLPLVLWLYDAIARPLAGG